MLLRSSNKEIKLLKFKTFITFKPFNEDDLAFILCVKIKQLEWFLIIKSSIFIFKLFKNPFEILFNL